MYIKFLRWVTQERVNGFNCQYYDTYNYGVMHFATKHNFVNDNIILDSVNIGVNPMVRIAIPIQNLRMGRVVGGSWGL